MSDDIRKIYAAIVAHQAAGEAAGEALRLMKLSEEVGEVTEAYIGWHGGNKRKGFTHKPSDIAEELCDVIITAQVALHDWAYDPDQAYAERLARVAKRVEEDGS